MIVPGSLSRSMMRLHGDRRDDIERHAGVVAFTVPGRAFDDRVVIGDARLL
jgi:hypothetical protein